MADARDDDAKKGAPDVAVAPKKRVSLPVVGDGAGGKTLLQQAQLGDDLATERSDTAWIGLGVLAIFVVLIPLAMLAMAALKWIYGASPLDGAGAVGALVVISILTVAISSTLGAFIVGRFGPRIGGAHGAILGALAGALMWGISRAWLGVVILVVTVPAAALGARLGRRARR